MVPKRADDAQLELNMNLFSSSQQIRGGTDPEGAPSAEQCIVIFKIIWCVR